MIGYTLIQDIAIILVVAGLVGWVCQRVGLPAVVGFLVAGMLVGPHTPIALIPDAQRVVVLAQIGLVFVMFSIGLRLSLQRLRRLGLSLMLATFISALVIYQLSRLLAVSLGWSAREGLFLAGMLMVSSSVIIGKILQEAGSNHERSGQYAVGVSALEDVIAVVMLTILTSIVQFGVGGEGTQVPETVLMLGAFVVLAGISGLLLVPWLLKRTSIAADEELQTLGLAAMLFGLAVVAQAAGYTLALGAFLVGVIVAETPHRHQVERTFEGMRDVFSAMFFVAVGMQIDARALWAEWMLIVGIAVFAVVLRTFAVAAGLGLIGKPVKDALRTGMAATPIGEFSFIIAYVGMTAGVVPPRFFPLAVGVSLVTTLVAVILIRRSEAIAGATVARQPEWVTAWLQLYHSWLERLRRLHSRNLLWEVSRKRIVQVGVGMLFVTGLIVFSRQLFALVDDALGRKFPPQAVQLGFWMALTLVVLAPLVAIWRNLSAMAMVYAAITTKGLPRAKRLRPLVATTLRIGFGVLIYMWLVAVVPAEGITRWVLLVSALVAVVALVVLRRKLIYWHSGMEVEILSILETGGTRATPSAAPWLQPHADWNLHMIDCTLPDLADCQGRRISELDLRARFGCSVVGIERQGFMIPLPPPDAVLYPRDKVLLLGTREQVKAGRRFLGAVTGDDGTGSVFEDVRMESIVVPEWSRAAGRTLEELSPAQHYGVQVAGVHRGGLRILNPGAHEVLRGGDEILVLGTPVQIAEFEAWLRERPEEDATETELNPENQDTK